MKHFIFAVCVSFVWLAGTVHSRACDIALALAVDISGSVDDDEFALQMGGLAQALRDPTVTDALVANKANLLLIQWTGSSRQIVSVPWMAITSHDEVFAFAEKIEMAPRKWRNFSTAIGEALNFTAAQFDDVSNCRRKVIDVSGDGVSNEGVEPITLHAWLIRQGFIVNGLAIEGSADDLTGYYRDNVMVGPKAFVMTANNFEDYPKRIRQKLIREITEKIAMLQ